MRLYMASAELKLANGNVYTTEDDTLELPSASQSGLKVFFDPSLEIEKGMDEKVVIDFDLTKTFKPIPANDPEDAVRYQMHPVLRVQDIDGGGRLSGYVSAADQEGPPVPLAGATVYVLPKDETDLDASIETTGTDVDGGWTVSGLAPGEYQVVAHHGALEGTGGTVEVASGQTTEVQLVLD